MQRSDTSYEHIHAGNLFRRIRSAIRLNTWRGCESYKPIERLLQQAMNDAGPSARILFSFPTLKQYIDYCSCNDF